MKPCVEKHNTTKKAKIQQKSGQAGKWQNYLRLRFTSQKETGDGTSIQEIAAEVIEQKHAERELWQMQLLINKKFGDHEYNDIGNRVNPE